VIFSHSNAKKLCDVPRNVPDDVLDKVKVNGGVVMVTFVAGFVSQKVASITQPAMARYKERIKNVTDTKEQDRIRKEIMDPLVLPKVTIGQVADHIDYIKKRIGVAHVGIGGDFDGNDKWPEGLSDVSMYPNLFAELIRRGWTDVQLEQLAGKNVLRALRGAESVAARMQAEQAKR
jgi:membrane dipeptidase